MRMLSWRPTAAAEDVSFSVEVEDRDGLTTTQTWTVDVRPVNRAPVFTSVPVTTAAAFAEYTYQAVVTDPDAIYGDTWTLSLVGGPTGLSMTSGGLVTWSPTTPPFGPPLVVLRAVDSRGAVTLQEYRLVVGSNNRSPRFTSTPRTLAIAGQAYSYDVEVTDPDAGDTPVLALVTAPSGMTVSSGVLVWSPTAADIRTHQVTVRATDREGVEVTQSFSLDVEATNHAPTISSTPPTTGTQGVPYTYAVAVQDANGRDGATFALLGRPEGMTVGTDGVVRWTPRADQVGARSVQLEVRDFGDLPVTQSWTIAVANVNDAPVFTSTPVLTATEDAAYTYTAVATDADTGDTVFYSVQGPRGMQIGPTSGVVTWTPGTRQVGSHGVQVRASDGRGPPTVQSFTVAVTNTNDAPEWVSRPETTVLAGARFSYRPYAVDPDAGDSVTYTLLSVLPGLTYDAANGLLSWLAPATGQATVTLRARDVAGAEALQTFVVQVVSDQAMPQVWATVTPTVIEPGAPAVLSVRWTDNATVATVAVTFRGREVVLDAEGRATITSTVPGVHAVEATAVDGSGNEATAEARLGVRDPSDTTAPVVALTSPLDDAVVLMQVPVTGTVAEANLVEWRLRLVSVDGTEERELGRGVEAVSGVLGVVDGTLLENGWWNLYFEAVDVNGRSRTATVTVELKGEAKPGVVHMSFIDMQVPVAGIPITVTRTYDSRVTATRDFGAGWDLEISAGKMEHNRDPGIGWSIHENFPPPSFPCTVVDELDQHYTTIRLGEREWYTFRPVLANVASSLGSCYADMTYEFVEGFVPGATLDVLSNAAVIHLSGSGELVDEISGLPWEPSEVLLTTFDGRQITVEPFVGITRVEDRNGNSVTISASGIAHWSGRSIGFTRDGEGRITEIEDPLGNTLVYTYDSAGDLIDVENQLHEHTTFEYSTTQPHRLTSIRRLDGLQVAALAYDESGRLHSTCTRSDRCSTFEHDLDERTQLTVDPTGRSTLVEYDDAGNIVRARDGAGQDTLFEYDAAGNMLRKTDPLNRVWEWTYNDRRRALTQVDPHDPESPASWYTTTRTYNVRGQITSEELPSGARVAFEYDAQGNLLEVRDELDQVLATMTYDGSGNQLTDGDPLGTLTFDYDVEGTPTTMADDGGNEFSFELDGLGRITEVASDGLGTTTFEIDPMGRMLSISNDGQESIAYEYEAFGPAWTSVSRPGLGTVTRELDAGGRTLAMYSPDGVVEYGYDAAGRLTAETQNGVTVRTHAYDEAGRLEVTEELSGATRTMHYDDSGSITRVEGPFGDTLMTYGADGSLASVTDPGGVTLTYASTPTTASVTNELGQTTTTILTPHGAPRAVVYPDGSMIETAYVGTSPLFSNGELPVMFADELDRVVSFTYTAEGILTSATDQAQQVWTYGHEAGRLVEVTSPLGDVSTIERDEIGRVAAVVAGDGARTEFSYSIHGDVELTRIATGETSQNIFDATGRLMVRSTSNGEVETFGYDDHGNLSSITDETGTWLFTTTNGLPASVEAPNSAAVSISRDVLGRPESVTVSPAVGSAQETEYEYDGGNRLTLVRDPLGGETIYTYDEAGRLSSRELPNGILTEIEYDLRDRVVLIRHRLNTTTLLSFEYTRSPSGEPTRIEREDGSYVVLAYDDAVRLASEQYFDAGDTLIATRGYAYDADGKRVGWSDGEDVRIYQYASGGKLTGVMGDANETYSHDDAGRVTEVARDGATRALSYDVRGLVTAVTSTLAGTIVAYTNDALGRRVAATSSSATRNLLVAPSLGSGFESVHLISNASNAPLASFVYAGERPLMRIQSGTPRFYLEDGNGSVVGLANATGVVVATFNYDAFGQIRSASGAESSAPASLGGDFRFHGMWLESATGLYHARAREYDARTGRFLSRDAARPDATRPETFNAYSFANANPFIYRDPSGHFTLTSLNMSMSIQDILQQVKAATVNELKDQAKEKIFDITVDIFARALTSALGNSATPVAALSQYASDAVLGDNFADFVKKEACNTLFAEGPLREWTHLEVAVNPGNGDPADDGFSCAQATARAWPRRLTRRPDFMLVRDAIAPSALPRTPGRKGLVVGDIKWSFGTFYRSYIHSGSNAEQWDAMVQFAHNHETILRPIMFIAVTPGGGRGITNQQLERSLQHLAIDDAVGLILFATQ